MKLSQYKTILHVVISLETGGLERFVLDLVSANQNDLKQLVVCLEHEGLLASNNDIEIISLGMLPGLHLRTAWDISKIVKDKQVDIIHTHNEKAQFYGGIAGFLSGVPVVHSKHGKNSLRLRTIFRNNFSARLCRKIVAVSQDAANECIHDERIPADKVLTILNGIDTDRFSPGYNIRDSKKRLGLGEDTLVIGIVARLAHVKDHATLIEAGRLLLESGNDFKLLIIGDGQLRQQLEELAQSLKIREQVIFTGMREDIPDLMRAMDIFALSSLSEGISLTLLEAMACCLPIVSTAVGGNPEVVVDGVTGFLVPPQDPKLFAEKLQVLLADFALREKMGQTGRQRVVNYFSISETADKYRKLYFTLAG